MPHRQHASGYTHSNSWALSTGQWQDKLREFRTRNTGVFLVIVSQFFGAIMTVLARLLETEGANGSGMHPLQILFARMSITSLLCFAYMYFKDVQDAPFGKRDVRALLVARGVGGFFGVTGLYFSLIYLPIAEATILTFLAPIVASFACSVLIHEPFPVVEQIAALVSLGGVVLIAIESPSDVNSGMSTAAHQNRSSMSSPERIVTTSQRYSAIGMGIVGVFGAASAFTTIRWIGKRAHPLVCVNYFSVWCTLVSTVSLIAIPDIGFKLPADAKEWLYFTLLGISGFLGQFLLTAGLQFERSSRANNMVYTLMIFAFAADKIVWGTDPTIVSTTGSILILGSAIYVAITKKSTRSEERPGPDVQGEMAPLAQEDQSDSDIETPESIRQTDPV